MISSSEMPHAILGVKQNATPDEIRRAYLALVREFPPEKDPDRFRAIHHAYQLLRSPLTQAKSLMLSKVESPDLEAIIAAASKQRVRLPQLALLALGDQE